MCVVECFERREQAAFRGAVSRSSFLFLRQKMCIVWIDRHVHKTGGTSVRHIMRELVKHGYMQMADGYNIGPRAEGMAFEKLMQSLRSLVEPCSPQLHHALFGIEAHEGENLFANRTLSAVRALRNHPSACCKPFVTTRTREPLEHYISTWRWYAARLYVPFGRTLETWAPRNLQAVLLAQTSPRAWIEGAKRWSWKANFNFTAANYEEMLRVLHEDVDLAWPLDRMDEGLRLLAQRLSLPLPALELILSTKHHVNPGPKISRAPPNWIGSDGREIDRVGGNYTCPDMGRCAALIARLAPFDKALHEHVTQRFSALLAAELPLPEITLHQPHAGLECRGEGQRCLRYTIGCGASCFAIQPEVVVARLRPETGAMNATTAASAPHLVLCSAQAPSPTVAIGEDFQLGRLHDAFASFSQACSPHGTVDVRARGAPWVKTAGPLCYDIQASLLRVNYSTVY